jgi:enterochelin esterase-like enzyme
VAVRSTMEIDSLEQILAKSRQAFSYDVVPGGHGR